MNYRETVVVRGGGDLASGVIYRLFQSGYKLVVLDIENPLAVRKNVSFCQSIYDGSIVIEGVEGVFCKNTEDINKAHNHNKIPVLIDPEGLFIEKIKPDIVIDGILAKRNLGTKKNMADIVIGLGPGFEADIDVHAVIETYTVNNNLSKVIYQGKASKNTGIPGMVKGYSEERAFYSPVSGVTKVVKDIGEKVVKGDVLLEIGNNKVKAPITGIVRGMIMNGIFIDKNVKIGDIEPRERVDFCYGISDKSRAIGGGVLEAILHLQLMNLKKVKQ